MFNRSEYPTLFDNIIFSYYICIYHKIMTLTQLDYLIAVADTGNFTLAAEKSFVTQPTLSMQMQKLEEELAVQIFNRKTKPIGLTAVGQKIVAQARTILEESQRMQDVIAQEKGLIGGRFRLGIIPTIMPTLLPLFMREFLKQHPQVVLEIEELNTQNILDALQQGKLDAGIAATPLQHNQILERVLYYEPFIGYVPDSHTLHGLEELEVDDLSSNPVLVLEDGHCFRNQTLNLCVADRSQNNKAFDLKSGSRVGIMVGIMPRRKRPPISPFSCAMTSCIRWDSSKMVRAWATIFCPTAVSPIGLVFRLKI